MNERQNRVKDTNDSLELDLTIVNRDAFLDLFYDPIEIDVNARTQCKLSILKIENGDFVLDRLYDELSNASLSYVLSRRELSNALKNPAKVMAITNEVRAKFQKPNDTTGEGGEVFLYALLEAMTGAPKLLSKMSLKTNNQMPVFGSDGLHILKADDDTYEMIFGESKMYGDLGQAISKAFQSMHDGDSDDFLKDRTLVAPQLMGETVSDEQLKYIENILLPPPGTKAKRPKKAFGVFVAFDIDVDDFSIQDHSDDEIEAEYQNLAQLAMTEKTDLIRTKIEQFNFGATPLYIFAVPILKKVVNGEQLGVAATRKALQRRLYYGRSNGDHDVA